MSGWRFENARFAFGAGRFDLAIPERQCTLLLGGNGAGKTTLLRALLGERVLHQGAAFLSGQRQSTAALSLRQLADLVTFVPQEPTFPHGSTVAALVATGHFGRLGAWARPSAADRESESRIVQRLGLTSLWKRRLETLSPGQRQRAFVARALVARTQLLLLDEPTNHLDPAAAADLWSWLREACANDGVGVVVASHDLTAGAQFADRVVALREGVAAYVGTARGLQPPVLEHVFGRKLPWNP